MPKKILGSGWRFPIKLDRRDMIAISQYEEKIKESIMIILGTAKGERVMRPEFGCDIHDSVFTVIDSAALTTIRAAVREALVLWETRVEVLAVTPDTRGLNEGRIDIEVQYKVRYTNSAFNLVYPFYLESEGRLS